MSITRQDVLHVAHLAHLDLTDAEVTSFTQQLGEILHYVDQLGRLDTSGVEPTAHLAVPRLPLVADEAGGSLTRDAATASAPRVVDGGFGVPAFVDD